MGPILKVVWKISALYTHRPIEARLSSTPSLSGSTSLEDKELQFSSLAILKTLKVKLEPPKDRTNGERGWEGVQTLLSPIIWEKPLLLQSVSSPPSFFGQRLREPRNWAAAPPPCLRRHTTATNALPCSLLCLSLSEQRKFSRAGSECRAWEQPNQPPLPPHWSSSALLGDPSQYVTTLYA